MTNLFVYGSLKQGFGLNDCLWYSEFCGEREIGKGYVLLKGSGFPFLVEREDGLGCKGELYIVNDFTLDIIDRIEGHPHFYKRKNIILTDGTKAQTYIHPDNWNMENREVIEVWRG